MFWSGRTRLDSLVPSGRRLGLAGPNQLSGEQWASDMVYLMSLLGEYREGMLVRVWRNEP